MGRLAPAVVLAATAVLVGCSDDSGSAREDLTQCEGSFVRRVDGGDPPADVLPPFDDAPTDREAAEAAFAEVEAQLEEQYGATDVELTDGFGRAWTGVRGDYDVVDVDDFGIVITLTATEDCPGPPEVYSYAGGLPLFFFAP